MRQHANYTLLNNGDPHYEPLTEQRERLAEVNGSAEPTLLGLDFHQWLDGAVDKTIDKIKGAR